MPIRHCEEVGRSNLPIGNVTARRGDESVSEFYNSLLGDCFGAFEISTA